METRARRLLKQARVKILRGLPEAHLYKLAMHTAVETHKAGKRIIAKGDIGDKSLNFFSQIRRVFFFPEREREREIRDSRFEIRDSRFEIRDSRFFEKRGRVGLGT